MAFAAPAGSAAALDGPPGVDTPIKRCTPTKKVACLGIDGNVAASAPKLAAAAARRGLGILTPTQVAGKAKARKLARTLGAGLARTTTSARAADAGSFGGAIRGDTTVRGGGNSLRYDYRFVYDIPDACPNPKNPDDLNGVVEASAAGRLIVTSVERRGRFVLRTDIVAQLQTKLRLTVTRRATLGAALPSTTTPDVATVRRTESILDTRTGKATHSSAGGEFEVYTYAADLKSARNMSDVDRMSRQESHEPPPNVDGPILSDSYNDLATRLAAHLSNVIWRAGHEAERYWRTPGKCIALALDAPAVVAPGGMAQIRAQVSSARGYSVRQVLGSGPGSATWENGEVVRGLSARSLVEKLPLPESDPWVEWTAPSAPWGSDAKPGFHLTLPTKAGLAYAEILFSAATDAFYEVDAASYSANNSATSSGMGLPCSVSGSVTENLTILGGQPFDPINQLAFSGTTYDGTIEIAPGATAKRSGTMHGCDISMTPAPPCNTNVDIDVPTVIGFAAHIGPNSPTADLTWVLPAIQVGDGGGGGLCFTPTSTAAPDAEKRTVLADDLLRPGPHTLTVTRNTSLNGAAGQITGVANASITFHRVNQDGSPYTG